MMWTQQCQNERTNVPISFRKRNQNIVSIWSRICSPGPNRNETNSGTNSKVLITFLLDIGTFVERLSSVCSFTVLTLQPPSPPLSPYAHQNQNTIPYVTMCLVTKYCDVTYACTQRTLIHCCTPRFIFKFCSGSRFIHISCFRYFYNTVGVLKILEVLGL
jgi:hypothetical protein